MDLDLKRILFVLAGILTLFSFVLFALSSNVPDYVYALLLNIPFSALLVESVEENDIKMFVASLLLLVLNTIPFSPNPSTPLGFLIILAFSFSLILLGLSFYEKKTKYYSWIGVLFIFAGALVLAATELAILLFEIGLGLLAYYFLDKGLPRKIKIPLK